MVKHLVKDASKAVDTVSDAIDDAGEAGEIIDGVIDVAAEVLSLKALKKN